MDFPVTLYHKDNGTPEFQADARNSKYASYPITVYSQEEYDLLSPGWRDNPEDAANWNPEDDVVLDNGDDTGSKKRKKKS